MQKLSREDKSSLIRLASNLPPGSEDRRTLLALLKEASLSPAEFHAKLESGSLVPAKGAKIFIDPNGENASQSLIPGERYKVKVWKKDYLTKGRGPWAGFPAMYSLEGRLMETLPSWRVKGFEELEAAGKPIKDGWVRKGKIWTRIIDGMASLTIDNAGPSKTWLKIVSEAR